MFTDLSSFFFFFKQKTAYEMRISDWSSDVCSSDLSAIQNFSKAFVEPVLSALKEGVNFTAELSFAAFSQVTTLSSNGDFSQSTSLVAQSLSIEVNQDTGEVSVSLAKLSFEQDIDRKSTRLNSSH